jgi:hypothetical protein
MNGVKPVSTTPLPIWGCTDTSLSK